MDHLVLLRIVEAEIDPLLVSDLEFLLLSFPRASSVFFLVIEFKTKKRVSCYDLLPCFVLNGDMGLKLVLGTEGNIAL
jgi:hypothetical protein